MNRTQRANAAIAAYNREMRGEPEQVVTPVIEQPPAPVDALVITFPGDVLVATVSGQRTPDDTLYYAEFMTELYGILGGNQA